MKSHCKLSSLSYFLLFPEAIQVPPSQKLSDPALKCPSDEVCIDLPARLSESLKDSKLDSSSQPKMSKQTQPWLSSQVWWHLPPSHPRRCVGPGLGFRAHSTLYQQPPHHSSPGVHPAPHHTTLLWQNPSLPRSARLLSLSHQPVRDKMLRIRDGSTSTDTRGLKLGQVFREGDKTSVFSVSDLMKSADSSHTKFSQH